MLNKAFFLQNNGLVDKKKLTALYVARMSITKYHNYFINEN